MQIALIIQMIFGALGGSVVGGLAKARGLGRLGNAVAGALGGGIAGQMMRAADMPVAQSVAIGLLGGAAGAVIASILRALLAKK